MAKNGLTKWFKEKWVDISAPKKVEDLKNVEEHQQVVLKEVTLNVYQQLKLLECLKVKELLL